MTTALIVPHDLALYERCIANHFESVGYLARTTGTIALAIVCLGACSKSEPPPPSRANLPPKIVAPTKPPPPVAAPPLVVEQAAPPPPPTVQQHIPGSPEAKAFVAAYVVKQPVVKRQAVKQQGVKQQTIKQQSRAANRGRVPDAYEKAYRNAARADQLLQRHAYVVSFDDVPGTNAVALSREHR